MRPPLGIPLPVFFLKIVVCLPNCLELLPSSPISIVLRYQILCIRILYFFPLLSFSEVIIQSACAGGTDRDATFWNGWTPCSIDIQNTFYPLMYIYSDPLIRLTEKALYYFTTAYPIGVNTFDRGWTVVNVHNDWRKPKKPFNLSLYVTKSFNTFLFHHMAMFYCINIIEF